MILTALKLIHLRAWGTLALVAALIAGLAWVRSTGYTAGAAAVTTAWNAQKVVDAKAVEDALVTKRMKDGVVAANQLESLNEHERLAARSRADALGLAAAAARLRDRANEASRGGHRSNDPASASTGPPTTATDLVYADLFSRFDTRLRQLAAEADATRLSGTTCEAQYDALPVTR